MCASCRVHSQSECSNKDPCESYKLSDQFNMDILYKVSAISKVLSCNSKVSCQGCDSVYSCHKLLYWRHKSLYSRESPWFWGNNLCIVRRLYNDSKTMVISSTVLDKKSQCNEHELSYVPCIHINHHKKWTLIISQLDKAKSQQDHVFMKAKHLYVSEEVQKVLYYFLYVLC
jgi:hypothetical protein